jgi:small-conductance mechanosensitive channel
MFLRRILTVNIAFPVLSSLRAGPFISASRKKCFPLTPSVAPISLISYILKITTDFCQKKTTTDNLFFWHKPMFKYNNKSIQFFEKTFVEVKIEISLTRAFSQRFSANYMNKQKKMSRADCNRCNVQLWRNLFTCTFFLGAVRSWAFASA